MVNKRKNAFTLVELIVVITILAILGTIAFINLQWYSIWARDSKRISDINNIQKKITIETSKWTNLSSLINTVKTNSWLTIDNTLSTSIQWTANFQNLKENWASFKDPITRWDYVLSYSIWWNGTWAYNFTQISTINEELNQAVVKWNYYPIKTWDSPSIIKDSNNNYIVDWWVDLPYLAVAWWGWSSSSSWWPIENWLCWSDNGWNFTSNPTNLCSAWTASSVTDNGSWNTYTWTCDWINWWTTDSCSANNTNISQYPWCNEIDITVWAYTISACNLWETIAGTDRSYSWGDYYQWWRNKNFPYTTNNIDRETTPIDWSIWLNASTDTYFLVRDASLASPYTWASTDITNNWWETTNTSVARQWPCASWYHVPSSTEWSWIVTAWWWWNDWDWMVATLKLAASGRYNYNGGTKSGQGLVGRYWSSSTNGNNADYLNFFDPYMSNPTVSVLNWARAFVFSVRCFKN